MMDLPRPLGVPDIVRDLMIHALPAEPWQAGDVPDPRFVYLPASHVRALRPDTMVVVGMRGAGKSFWWSALQDKRIRRLVNQLARETQVQEETLVRMGFGERHAPWDYPQKDVLAQLLDAGIEPRAIWRTVVVHKLADDTHPVRTLDRWRERIEWVRNNPEPVDHLLADKDHEFERKQLWFLVLFDALDRSAGNWKDMYRLIRGLLQIALEFRSYRRLRVKCFLRTDQMDTDRVADFPDASKVVVPRVELSWPERDLYGLLWQYLANADHPAAQKFRHWAERDHGVRWSAVSLDGVTVWRALPESRAHQDGYRNLFHHISGPWMGRDPRRGFPYTWIPGHLSDSHRQTSPRPFLAALRAAAEDTRERYPDHKYALHYESIKRGVRRASQIRVNELKEDYPWVDWLMNPLQGMTVPCSFKEIAVRWEEAGSLRRIEREVERGDVRLEPAHWREGPEGLSQDLEDLGIFFRTRDNRINIPDVFRVGYGLGRRGGVPPVRRGEES
ncbi:MAG: hypothetical protein H0Z37_02005 [Firmicutes bacterium]|nr:hypothetical protein [Bacillota bacterium]